MFKSAKIKAIVGFLFVAAYVFVFYCGTPHLCRMVWGYFRVGGYFYRLGNRYPDEVYGFLMWSLVLYMLTRAAKAVIFFMEEEEKNAQALRSKQE